MGNRKKLINGNGFIFGVPGSGKSFFAKQEMGSVFLNTDDDVIVIDPMNEYFDIAKTYGGAVVNLSAYTRNFVNPLEADMAHTNEKGLREVIADKSEFMLSLCDQLLGNALNQKHHSIIDRCVRGLYMEAWKRQRVPVMSDFYRHSKCSRRWRRRNWRFPLSCLWRVRLTSSTTIPTWTWITVSRFTAYKIWVASLRR